MKFIIYILLLLIAGSCTYDFPKPDQPTSGSVDFSKYIAVGSSITAGYMDGSIYTRGQNSSYPAILAEQLKLVGGGDFIQPDINSVNGYYATNPLDGSILGRLILVTNPTTGATIPTPTLDGDAIELYTGASVNNFGVPGIKVTEVGFTGYGLLNPYFGRFASAPSTASVLGDAVNAAGTFFTFWLGNNDVLSYAISGASGIDGGINRRDITDLATFTVAYNASLSAMLSGGAKGMVANIPNLTTIPYFELVAYNSIPLDEATATALNSIAAFGGYNSALDLLAIGIPGFSITQEEADKRKVFYTAGNNPILIHDKDLVDLSAVLGSLNPILAFYGQTRQITSSELVTLSAATVLGTSHPLDPGNGTIIWGVSFPIGDEYILTTNEITLIEQRIIDFNSVIATAVNNNSENVGLLDINAIFTLF